MAEILGNGLVQFSDGRILYSDSVITGQDYLELSGLLHKLNPVLARGAMVGFPFISGGGGGGVGAPGSPGSPGLQGATGIAGAAALQGVTGVAGATGVLAADIFAATRVVDPGGAGTDLTIASAIAALPATGGDIYIKPGTYMIAATLALPDKHVRIRGAAYGNALTSPVGGTVLNIATAGIPLFSVAAGFTHGDYTFADFSVTGDGGVASDQTFINLDSAADVVVERVMIGAAPGTNSIRTIVRTSVNPDVTFRDCSFRMPNSTLAALWTGTSSGGLLTWDNVDSQLFSPGTNLVAFTGAPNFTVIDSYFGVPGTITAVFTQVIWTGFKLDNAEVTVGGAASWIGGSHFTSTSIHVNAQDFKSVGNEFSLNAGIVPQLEINGAAGVADATVAGCRFAFGTTGVAVNNPNVDISGCLFTGHGSQGVSASGTSTLSVIGCRFAETVPVNELAATVIGRYDSNEGFRGSVIAGPRSTVENENFRNVRTWGAVGDGVTDDTAAITAAIAALPAAGGVLYFPQGNYLISAALALPAKPVKVIGAGKSTVINIGGNAIAAFSITNSFEYIFEDFSVLGTSGVAGQLVWNYAVAVGSSETLVTRVSKVTSSAIEGIVAAALLAPQIIMEECNFALSDVATSFFASGGMFLNISQVRCFANAINARGGFKVGASNVVAHGCELGLQNFGATLGQTGIYSMFVECSLTGDSSPSSVLSFAGPMIEKCAIFGVRIDVPFGGGSPGVISGNRIAGTAMARFIDITAGGSVATLINISDNTFGPATSEQVRVNGTNCVISGNANCKVTEATVADSNKFENILSTSTIIGPNSTVEGVLRKDVVGGVTTGAFVTVFTHTNLKGILGIGTIKNTGGVNSMNVKETVTDAFGVTDSVTTVVAPGNDLLLDPQTNFATARPPYVSFAVAVDHPVAATTYDLHHATEGAQLP